MDGCWSATRRDPTYTILGGGLAGGLAALALANAGRGPGVTLLEQGETLGGNHTWSFHETDLDPADRPLVMPLVERRWARQAVRFPGHARTLETGYATVTSDRFARVVGERLARAGVRVLTGRRVVSLDEAGARLDDGASLTGDVVLDARGPAPEAAAAAGFQKFVGLEVELADDGPWSEPLVMDATVAQTDGFRFVYVLPFSRRRVLVEDTTYSDGPALDRDAFEARVHAYVEASGARVRSVLRREHGVLPLPLAGQAGAAAPAGAALPIGYRGGFFHPVTGYSLPVAARVARAVAGASTRHEARRALDDLVRALEPQRRFERLLNRLMFSAMPAAARWQALARFYRLPERTIARFYASRSTLLDRARVLVGRPPRGVAWTRLLGAVAEGA
jgi:lycopene beta-cyclase